MLRIIINQLDNNKRLDVFLSERFNDISRSQWQKKIKAGEVLVDDKKINVSYRVKEKDKVKIVNYKLQITNKLNQKQEDKNKEVNFKNIKVVFEGDDYIVVNKPAGVVVHPDSKYKEGTLINWLMEKYPEIKGVGEQAGRPGIVHRLDKEVSGLIVIARSQLMFEHLKREFQERRVDKEYLVLVHGVIKKDEGQIRVPIRRSKTKGLFVADSNFSLGGRLALTQYEVIQRFKHFSLLKVKILTGRTHQIRVHLTSIGHSVAGDNLYVTHDVRVKKKGVDLGRLWLHAVKLSFNDLDFRRRQFKTNPPIELEKFLTELK